MKKALVFGAAAVGIKAKMRMEEQGIKVVAFADNDSFKWNKILEECPIIAPHNIQINDYDIFAIGLYKSVENVKKQLEDMGVKEDNIIVPVPVPVPASLYYNNKYLSRVNFVEKGVVMIWGGIENCSKEIQELMKNENRKRIDFGGNYWGFKYFIEDFLLTAGKSAGKDFWERSSVSDYNQLCVDIYFIEDSQLRKVLKINDTFSEQFFFYSDNYFVQEMANNKNTYNFWKIRLPRAFDFDFLERIEELKCKMHEFNISMNEICVVSGAVLQAYGLRESQRVDDLDIIMTDKFREMYGKGLVIVSDYIEAHPQNEIYSLEKSEIILIYDEEIILNADNYFWFRGVKFLTLNLLYYQKKCANRKAEVKLMDYFFEENMHERREK